MNYNTKKTYWFITVALVVFILDQWSKYTIRTTPGLHRKTLIDGWLQFNFTSNPGMALGITWADTWIISLVSIAATIVIVFITLRLVSRANKGFMICMGLIIGGALGNIADRLYMAKIEGYGGILDGHVVDFIHFKLRIGSWDVFPYIFNVADMAISVSIVTLLIFSKWLIPPDKKELHADPDPESDFEAVKQETTNSSEKKTADSSSDMKIIIDEKSGSSPGQDDTPKTSK